MDQESNIIFEVDSAVRLRLMRACGIITDEILFEAFERLVADPDYDPTLYELLDLREVDRLAILLSAVDRLEGLFGMANLRHITRLRLSLLQPMFTGMARMYGLRRWKSELFMVSRNLEEAEK